MARNKAKFRYYRVGIPLDSDLPGKLDQDARSTGMTTEVAKLIVIRLADFYKGVSMASTPVIEEEGLVVEEVDDMEQKRKNALASADEWE